MDRERRKTRRKTRRTKQSLHLPKEILEEILSRLGVKSLLRLRCVSRSWLSIIDSKRFIKIHLQYSTKNTYSARHRVLVHSRSGRKQYSLRTFLEGTNLSPLGRLILPKYEVYADSCNGLLCLYQKGLFRLLNPSTRVSKELPKDLEIDNGYAKIGFGWDESSGAYKVLAGSRVYSSKTNSWKTVEAPHLHSGGGEGVFVGGKIHWLIGETISSFNVKSEVFGTIELPNQIEDVDGCLLELGGVVRGCLCLSVEYEYVDDDHKSTFDVWVMKEYGVRESWVKLATIDLGDGPPGVRIIHHCARVIGEDANGEILIVYGLTSLVNYCPINGVIRQKKYIRGGDFESLYIESLVSPVREISSI